MIWEKNQPHKVWEQPYLAGSSGEYWTMCESMIQQIGGNDEDYGSCKV